MTTKRITRPAAKPATRKATITRKAAKPGPVTRSGPSHTPAAPEIIQETNTKACRAAEIGHDACKCADCEEGRRAP